MNQQKDLSVNEFVSSQDKPIVLFDGICNLCNHWVNFIIKNDPSCQLTLCSVQSATGQKILAHFGYPTEVFDTMLLVNGETCLEQSDAVLAVLRHLGKPWSRLSVVMIIPTPLRDAIYRFIAHHRYRIFGKRQTCLVPSPEQQKHFIDQDDCRITH